MEIGPADLAMSAREARRRGERRGGQPDRRRDGRRRASGRGLARRPVPGSARGARAPDRAGARSLRRRLPARRGGQPAPAGRRPRLPDAHGRARGALGAALRRGAAAFGLRSPAGTTRANELDAAAARPSPRRLPAPRDDAPDADRRARARVAGRVTRAAPAGPPTGATRTAGRSRPSATRWPPATARRPRRWSSATRCTRSTTARQRWSSRGCGSWTASRSSGGPGWRCSRAGSTPSAAGRGRPRTAWPPRSAASRWPPSWTTPRCRASRCCGPRSAPMEWSGCRPTRSSPWTRSTCSARGAPRRCSWSGGRSCCAAWTTPPTRR